MNIWLHVFRHPTPPFGSGLRSFLGQNFDSDGIAGAGNPGEITGGGESTDPDNLRTRQGDRPERALLGGNVFLGEKPLELLFGA